MEPGITIRYSYFYFFCNRCIGAEKVSDLLILIEKKEVYLGSIIAVSTINFKIILAISFAFVEIQISQKAINLKLMTVF